MDKKKILVVDDEPDFLNLIKMRLEASNYEVLLANNGTDALNIIKSNKPDAVILDIMMPGIDGLEVLRQLRKKHKDLPVFILTAFSNEERFKLADQFNASGFMVKTGNLKEEVDNINSVLKIADRFKGK